MGTRASLHPDEFPVKIILIFFYHKVSDLKLIANQTKAAVICKICTKSNVPPP